MLTLVSKERIEMKNGYVAYALPKTGLAKDGILALSTGIVDPGYSGKLSTVAINFDKEAYRIKPGDPFLRLVFHTLSDDVSDNLVTQTDEEYIDEHIRDSMRHPATFLDVPGQLKKISEQVLGRQTRALVTVLAIFTVIFGLWNLGGWWLLQRQDSMRDEQIVNRYDERFNSLEDRLRGIERQMPIISSSQNSTAAKAKSGKMRPGAKSD